MKREKECEFCHRIFPRPTSYRLKNSAWKIRKYCSRKCMGEARKKRTTLICVYCKKPYEEIKARIGRSSCCSRQCADLKRRKRQYVKCQICGREKEVRISDVKRGLAKFCSRKCFSKYLSTKYLGSKGNGWKGGVSTLQQLARHTTEYRKWRTDVFKRDNWRCVLCHSILKIQADHFPIPFSYYVNLIFKKHKNDTLRLMCLKSMPEVWDINNGRTLCLKCHKNTETWGNTKLLRSLPRNLDFACWRSS